jgi:hypothetical protein
MKRMALDQGFLRDHMQAEISSRVNIEQLGEAVSERTGGPVTAQNYAKRRRLFEMN